MKFRAWAADGRQERDERPQILCHKGLRGAVRCEGGANYLPMGSIEA
jgi:hypothetical protein